MSNNEDTDGSRVPVDGPVEEHPYFSLLGGQYLGDDEMDPALHDDVGDSGNETTTSC